MPESRTARVQKNVVTSILQNFVSIGISFVSRMIFVRILDESYLGINGLFSNILNILSLADLGMGAVMMYSLYAPIEEGDTGKISALVSFFRRIYLGIALTVLLAGLAFLPFLSLVVNLKEPVPLLEGYYVLSLINVVVSYLFVYRTTLISADQKMYILNKYIMVFKIITFVVQSVVLVLFRDYFVYLAAAVVVSFISNVCQNLVSLKMYPFLKGSAPKLEKKEKNRIFHDVKAMFLYRISGTIQSNTDNILISVFSGTVSVGFYSNYAMVVTQITGIITLIFNSVKASIGSLVVNKDTGKEDKFFLFQVSEMCCFWIVGFCTVCFVALFQDFIQLFFGAKYVVDWIVVIAVVLNFYTNNIRQSVWAFREATGLFQQTKHITAVTAVLNILFSILFGYFWGMAGILLATVLTRMLYAWWKEPVVLYGFFFKRSAVSYLLNYIKNAVLCIVTCAVTYFLCEWVVMENSYMEFAVHMLICCILPNVIFLCVFWNTKEFRYIRKKLLSPMIRKVMKKNSG